MSRHGTRCSAPVFVDAHSDNLFDNRELGADLGISKGRADSDSESDNSRDNRRIVLPYKFPILCSIILGNGVNGIDHTNNI